MEIVLNHMNPASPEYTGDPSLWPDGLYRHGEVNYMLVCNGYSICLHSTTGARFDHYRQGAGTGLTWTRVPGYTGGIMSITPELGGE